MNKEDIIKLCNGEQWGGGVCRLSSIEYSYNEFNTKSFTFDVLTNPNLIKPEETGYKEYFYPQPHEFYQPFVDSLITIGAIDTENNKEQEAINYLQSLGYCVWKKSLVVNIDPYPYFTTGVDPIFLTDDYYNQIPIFVDNGLKPSGIEFIPIGT